jgi:hypothetical protein
MKSITYISAAVRLFTGSELTELLNKSRVANLKHGVTGMLVYNAGSFMQAIEGAEEDIDRLYANICRDKSHHRITTLIEEKTEKRAFADWSMGFHDLTNTDLSRMPGYTDFLKCAENGDFKGSSSFARQLLATFRDNMRRD